MAESHVVSGLKAKRAELAGAIAHGKRQVARWEASLLAIDDALRVLADQPPTRLALQPLPERFRRMRTGRLVANIIREAGTVPSVREIALVIIRQHGGDADPALLRVIERRVHAVVGRMVV